MSEKTKLLPCPFCGGKPRFPSYDAGDGDFVVMCPNCGASAKYDDRRSRAILAWNTRASAPAVAPVHQTGGTGWQPIETAPKDGTPFEACGFGWKIFDGVLVWDQRGRFFEGVAWKRSDIFGRNGMLVEHWEWRNDGGIESTAINEKSGFELTHWRVARAITLPAPPASGESK